MNTRRVWVALLLVLLVANSWSGWAKVMAFRNRYLAKTLMEEAKLENAMARLRASVAWRPVDAQSYIGAARVAQQALANGLPLEGLEDKPLETLGTAVAGAANGVSRNPVDPWGWFNLSTLYQGYRSARRRDEILRRAGQKSLDVEKLAVELMAGESGIPEPDPNGPEKPVGLEPEDIPTIAALHKAIELEPNFYAYYDLLAKLYWDRGMNEEAARYIRISMGLAPRIAAHALLTRSEFVTDLAEPILQGIEDSSVSTFVGAITSTRARAEMLSQLRRHEEAITAYAELRRLGGTILEPECDLALGKLEQRRGRFTESIPILEKAALVRDVDRSGISALYYLGKAHSREGNSEKAVEYFREYLAERPDIHQAYIVLARELDALEKSDEAERILIAAVRKFPTTPLAYRMVVDHLRAQGKPKQAIPYAEGLHRVDPADLGVEKLIRTLKEEAGLGP